MLIRLMPALVIAFLTTACQFAPPSQPPPSDPDRPVRASNRAGAYRGEIIDTHLHWIARHPVEYGPDGVAGLLGQGWKNGVSRMIFLPTPHAGAPRARGVDGVDARPGIFRSHADRAGLLCGGGLTRVMADALNPGFDPEILEKGLSRLRRWIRAGDCRGIGEIGPYTFAKGPHTGTIHLPLTAEPMVKLARLAAAEGVPLELHIEPVTPAGRSYRETIDRELAQLMQRAPGLRVILSHTGMTSPKRLAALLTTYPDMMVNLKLVRAGTPFIQWDHLAPIADKHGNLFEEWAQLFEIHSERFMIGSDMALGGEGASGAAYEKSIDRLRRVLGSLYHRAAAEIAYRNALITFWGAR